MLQLHLLIVLSSIFFQVDEETIHRLIRIWCGCHQLDINMQKFYKTLLEETWETDLTTLIGHLRRQQILCDEIGSQCPLFADTRWLSMDRTTNYIMSNRDRLREHLDGKPNNKPSMGELFWLVLIVADFVAGHSNSYRERTSRTKSRIHIWKR